MLVPKCYIVWYVLLAMRSCPHALLFPPPLCLQMSVSESTKLRNQLQDTEEKLSVSTAQVRKRAITTRV